MDESDWINWSSDDLLIWLQQKKRFPEEINLKSIEHEMRSNNINGTKMSQLTHSTMLSYGFTEYNHRSKLLQYIAGLLQQYPSASQKPNYAKQQQQQQQIKNNANNNNKNNDNNNQKNDDEKKDELTLLKEANLNESQWKSWNCDQVWSWIKIKNGWSNTEEMEYMLVHKINEYEEKLKSQDVNLTGARFVTVQQDIKTQKLLKAIGFPFSQRKAVYKYIDNIIKQYPN